jgi:hypothetical protein
MTESQSVACGPAHIWQKSKTLIPERGSFFTF